MSQFSASLMLADMDYIAPSQACIKPKLTRSHEEGGGEVHRHVPGAAPPPELIQITLQDCLACSGCITTAETMLVTSQSREEVVHARRQWPRRPVVVSLSDQAVCSIAAQLGKSALDTYHTLSGFFRHVVGATIVMDLAWATKLSTEQTTAEYFRRLHEAPSSLPLIVSACPGWVCYCEKQYPELLPHLCHIMSAQGIAGSIVKRLQALGALSIEARSSHPTLFGVPQESSGVVSTPPPPGSIVPPPPPPIDETRTDVFHLSVQPCFDRKLEAARDHSPPDEEAMQQYQYTDCVLSAQEVLMWLMECDPEGTVQWATALDDIVLPPSFKGQHHMGDRSDLIRTSKTEMLGSGGYHAHLLSQIAAITSTAATPMIVYDVKRNHNHCIARLEGSGALPAPHLVTVAYGFQHIQNIVRGIRRKLQSTLPYTFIELMACPEGCLNGGGQVRTTSHDETLQSVRSTFQALVAGRDDDSPGAPSSSSSSNHELPSKVLRVERSPLQTAVDAWIAQNAMATANAERVDDALFPLPWLETQFRDRKKELEETLQVNPVHSLKW